MVSVGRIARPHGLRGEVVVAPDTDFAEQRFAPGAIVYAREGSGVRPLAVGTMRLQGVKPIVGFAGCRRVEDAEALVGLDLRVPEEALQPLAAHTYYHHQLAGCVVETVAGVGVGTVTRVDGGSGGSLLVVDGAAGEVLVPLSQAICRAIDVAGKRIVIDPPAGLLELNEVRHRDHLPAHGARGRRGRRRRTGD